MLTTLDLLLAPTDGPRGAGLARRDTAGLRDYNGMRGPVPLWPHDNSPRVRFGDWTVAAIVNHCTAPEA